MRTRAVVEPAMTALHFKLQGRERRRIIAAATALRRSMGFYLHQGFHPAPRYQSTLLERETTGNAPSAVCLSHRSPGVDTRKHSTTLSISGLVSLMVQEYRFSPPPHQSAPFVSSQTLTTTISSTTTASETACARLSMSALLAEWTISSSMQRTSTSARSPYLS